MKGRSPLLFFSLILYPKNPCSLVLFPSRVIVGRPMKPFEFPDGYNASFGIERYRATEVLFNPAEFAFQVR